MSASLPPDRGALRTEHRHEASVALDTLTTRACVDLMIADHARVRDAVAEAAESLTRFIDHLVCLAEQGGRFVLVGAGTSGRLGVLDASECPPTFQSDPSQVVGIIAGGDVALRKSAEGAEDEADGARTELKRLALSRRDTLLGIAAGGTTPYVLGAIRFAKSQGAATGLLTCAPLERARASGAVGDAVDHLIFLDTGPELLTGSTRMKAGSATKLVLNIISTTLFVRLGKVYSNLMVDLRATNDKLRDRAIRILIELCPELNRVEAAGRIEAAGGELKTAIVMQRLGMEAEAAKELLRQSGGRLRVALGGD